MGDEATPRPWRVEVRHHMDAADEYIVKSNGLGVAYHAKEHDAALIVEAVNSYDADRRMEYERDVWRSKVKYLRNVALDDAAKVCRQCPDSHWGPWIEKHILALKTKGENDERHSEA
jgi:hypothetical protein